MEEYQDIINAMKYEKTVQPPENFTGQVMCRISNIHHDEAKSTILGGILGASGPVSRTECSFCFLVTGIFYLVFGLMLKAGMRNIHLEKNLIQWIWMQPWVALVTAILFITLSFVLFSGGSKAIKAARLGIIFYVGFAVLNGLAVLVISSIPATIILSALIICIGVVFGILLEKMIDQCQGHITGPRGYRI